MKDVFGEMQDRVLQVCIKEQCTEKLRNNKRMIADDFKHIATDGEQQTGRAKESVLDLLPTSGPSNVPKVGHP